MSVLECNQTNQCLCYSVVRLTNMCYSVIRLISVCVSFNQVCLCNFIKLIEQQPICFTSTYASIQAMGKLQVFSNCHILPHSLVFIWHHLLRLVACPSTALSLWSILETRSTTSQSMYVEPFIPLKLMLRVSQAVHLRTKLWSGFNKTCTLWFVLCHRPEVAFSSYPTS